MKHAFLFLFICLLTGCANEKMNDLAPSSYSKSGLLSKWKLISFENKKPLTYDSYIEITKNLQAPNLFTINGKGPVNFFWINCEIDFQTYTMKMGSLNGTQIAIKTADEPLENDLIERIAESSIFELSADGQTLIFYNAKKTKSLIFKHN